MSQQKQVKQQVSVYTTALCLCWLLRDCTETGKKLFCDRVSVLRETPDTGVSEERNVICTCCIHIRWHGRKSFPGLNIVTQPPVRRGWSLFARMSHGWIVHWQDWAQLLYNFLKWMGKDYPWIKSSRWTRTWTADGLRIHPVWITVPT